MKKPWFRAKKYGWGWGLPLRWQGWAVLGIYFVFVIYEAIRIKSQSYSRFDNLINFVPEFVIATAILILICYLTGEKPKWRWGGK